MRFGSGPRGLVIVSQTVSFVALCTFGTPQTLNPGPIIVGLTEPRPAWAQDPMCTWGLWGKTGEQSMEGGLAASDKGKAWDPVISTELWARKHYFGFFPKCKKLRKCSNRLARMSRIRARREKSSELLFWTREVSEASKGEERGTCRGCFLGSATSATTPVA